jgi:hypothetical protein
MSASPGKALRPLWSASPPLVIVTCGMLVTLALNGTGLLVDPRIIMGDSAWLKLQSLHSPMPSMRSAWPGCCDSFPSAGASANRPGG